MLNNNLEKVQNFVIGQCLSDYPPDATYQEICDWITCNTCDDETGKPIVTVWQPLEYCDILHIMDNMLSATLRLLEAK